MMETVWQDVKYAARALRKTPGFTIAAVMSLGGGLGASVAVFSIVNTIYFTTLPYTVWTGCCWWRRRVPRTCATQSTRRGPARGSRQIRCIGRPTAGCHPRYQL